MTRNLQRLRAWWASTPCHHSRDANRVATDGAHTLARVREQMALLSADDHATALRVELPLTPVTAGA